MKTSLEHTIIKKGYYRAKFEKNKLVEVINVSKSKVWFNYENSRYVYNLQRFLIDFIEVDE